MLRPRALALFGTLALVGAVVGFAASLTVTASSLGADNETTPRCTTAALGVIPNLTTTTVTSVTINNLPSGCGGATIQVSVNNQVTSSTGTSTVPAGGGSVTVTLAAAVAVAVVEEIDLVVTGP